MAIYELEHIGVPFNRTADGTIAQRAFGGHTRDFGQSPIRGPATQQIVQEELF
jgi:succinate dehydrogenase / fumarate reductase, flavoprotein subunit